MQFTVEIDDESLKSLEIYLANQVEQKQHETTKQNMLVRKPGHENAQAFIDWIVKRDMDQIVDAYPTGPRAEIKKQIAALQEQLKGK